MLAQPLARRLARPLARRIVRSGDFSPAAQDYFARVSSAGGTVTHPGPVAAYIDALVALGGAYWDNMPCHCLFAGVSYAGTVVPLRNGMVVPTLVNFVSGDHNSVTGLKGNGSTKYANLNRNNNAEAQNSQSLSVYIDTVQTSGTAGFYVDGGSPSNGASMLSRSGVTPENAVSRSRNAVANVPPQGAATGFVGQNRAASTGYRVRAGATNYDFTQGSQAPASAAMYLFSSGGTDFFCDGRLKSYHVGPALDLETLEGLQNTLFAAIT
jgi:hypothetical protein